jgi:hypothetical protein
MVNRKPGPRIAQIRTLRAFFPGSCTSWDSRPPWRTQDGTAPSMACASPRLHGFSSQSGAGAARRGGRIYGIGAIDRGFRFACWGRGALLERNWRLPIGGNVRTSRERRQLRTRNGPNQTVAVGAKGRPFNDRRHPDQHERVPSGSSRQVVGRSFRLLVSFSPAGALHGGPRHAQNLAVDSPIAATRNPASPRADA